MSAALLTCGILWNCLLNVWHIHNLATNVISLFQKAGETVIPAGVICFWSGTVATIPSGWLLCDGSNGTPDLRDKFIIGARQDDSGAAKTNVTGSLTQSGGAATHTHTLLPEGVAAGTGAETAITELSEIAAGSTLPPYYALALIMKA